MVVFIADKSNFTGYRTHFSRPKMKYAFVVFLSLLSTLSVFASDPDSLFAAYKTAPTADERAKIAFSIAGKYLFTTPKVAVPYLRATISEAPDIKSNRKFLGKCYNAMGIYYYYQAHYDSALIVLEKAKDIAAGLNEMDDLNKARKNTGLAYSGKGDYAAAVKVYLETLEYFRAKKDTAGVVGNLNDIGNTYILLKNYPQALKFQQEAVNYLRKYKNQVLLGNVYNSIGTIYDDLGKPDSARVYYEKSLKLKEKHGNLLSIINTKHNICSGIDSKTAPQESIQCFTELLAFQQKADNKPGLVRTYSNLSVAYRHMGKYDKALEMLNIAEKHAKALNDAALLAQLLSKKAEVQRLTGDLEKANQNLQTYIAVKDSVFYADRNKETLELAAKYELAKKETEISENKRKLLQTQNEKLQAELGVRNRNYWLLALVLILTGGIFGTVVFTQRARARQQKEKALAILEERDRGLKAIIDAQEEERIRIARELHDGVGNQLLALKMGLGKVLPQNRPGETEKVSHLLSDVIEEVRSVSHQMMPKVLQEFGIVPALHDMLEKTLGTAGIKYDFETHNLQPRYPQRLETALFRVSQELVNNIIKHSGATLASLQLLETNQTLVLFLEDNGRGISSGAGAKTKDGIGITSVKSRISAVNGEMNIAPGQSTGTVVTIRIPITP